MSKTVLLSLLFCTLLSCSNTNGFYRIDGQVKGIADGETIKIATSPDGVLLEEQCYSVVKDGKFYFDGTVDECKVGYICHPSLNRNHCSILFIEKGDIKAIVDDGCCRITGTPMNNLYNIVEDTIAHYIANLKNIEEQFYSRTLNEEELARLSAEGLMMQEKLVTFLRKAIKENIENILGLYLLVTYNDFFTAEELRSLIKQIPPSSIDRLNNSFYDTIVNIVQEQQKTGSFN